MLKSRRKNEKGFGIIIIFIGAAFLVGSLLASDGDSTNKSQNTQAQLQQTTQNAQLSKLSIGGGEEEEEFEASANTGNAASLSQGFAAAENFEPALSSQAYLDKVFTTAENPMSKLYLPNYAYSQSLVYAQNDVNIFGQVRILGGVVSKGRTQLGYGAMITAVPQYVTRRTTPTQPRYHITEWKEL